jgi:nitroreductase
MSLKLAQTDYPILDLLSHRWSPRAFAPRPVEVEKLRSLFEAARWGASSYGEQPWRFLVAASETDAQGFEMLASCLMPSNAWARKAPVLALSATSLKLAHNGAPNRYAYHDVGFAMGNLAAQATSMGLYLHQMGGFERERAREVCAIPADFDPVAMIALGYVGDPATLTEDQQKKELAPRHRKPLSEIVFRATFGETSKIL